MPRHRYFELDEFLASDTAKRRGIDNTPTFEIVLNLDELVSKVLDPLRSAWGGPINITSGYRCPALNKAVNGAATSVHMIGYAADMMPANGEFERFRQFTVDWLRKTRTKFDQLIIETSGSTKWLHIGLYNNSGQQRGQIKSMTV